LRTTTNVPDAHEHILPLVLATELRDPEELGGRPAIQERIVSCPECLGQLEILVYWLDTLGHWAPAVAPEFVSRHRLFSELLYKNELHAQRLRRIRFDFAFHNWGLCRLLLDESRQAFPRSLSYSIQLAELAHAVARTLPRGFYGTRWVADLCAEAAVLLAVLERQRGRCDEATRLIRLAGECLDAGTGRIDMSLLIQVTESLLSKDKPSNDAVVASAEIATSSSPSRGKPNRPWPAHRLLERCKAAIESRSTSVARVV